MYEHNTSALKIIDELDVQFREKHKQKMVREHTVWCQLNRNLNRCAMYSIQAETPLK